MKYLHSLVLVISINLGLSYAKPETIYTCPSSGYWSSEFGLSYWINSIISESNGDFVAAGYAFDTVQYINAFMARITSFGEVVWAKPIVQRIQYLYHYGIDDIYPISDGYVIAVGDNMSVRKISANDGTILWTKDYSSGDVAYSIAPTRNGNFLVGGSLFNYYSPGVDSQFYSIMEIDSSGDTMWSKQYHMFNGQSVHDIVPTSEGNYLIAGAPSIFSIDSTGDTLWVRAMPPGVLIYSIAPTPDGNYLGAGGSNTGQYISIYLLKITASGDILWTRAYTTLKSVAANKIVRGNDGNFVLLGDQELVKVDEDGNVIWIRTCGSGVTAVPTPQGDFVLSENLGQLSGGFATTYAWLFYEGDTKYAYKNIPFSYKIPTSGDSTTYTYTPKKVPAGMSVSGGGVITWTPSTDSVYLEQDTFIVANRAGKIDTLSMDIAVNSPSVKNKFTREPLPANENEKNLGIQVHSYSSNVFFSFSSKAIVVCIYDIHGRLVTRLPIRNGTALWCGTGASGNPVSAGRYFARVAEGKQDLSKAFVLIR
jgi:hypothetical protein